MISKQQYEILLESIQKFDNPDIKKEQYHTESPIASKLINIAYMNNHIKDKVVIDLGCGTGFLGIGALINDAKKVIFVDIDNNAIKILKENIQFIKDNYDVKLCDFEIIQSDINDLQINEPIDTVIMNPPFGLRNKNIDMVFLEKSVNLCNTIYMIQKKIRIKQKISRFAKKFDFKVNQYDINYKMKKQYDIHKKKYKKMDFSIILLTKDGY